MNYYCQYCDARCWKMIPESLYWNCSKCSVRFFVYKDDLAITEFTVDLSIDKKYKVELHHTEGKTKIIYVEKVLNTLAMDYDLNDLTVIETPYIINVKPDNLKEKLRTLLLFS